ncbi:MAG: iojap-like protein [Deltaproteobacteria bacterium]|nr:iojap-like protein [Deltaproteobacteria bacterium]
MLILDLARLTDIADFFVVASGTSDRQVRTVTESVELGMKEKGVRPLSKEGYDEGRWIIVDYGDVVLHAFLEPLRELYDLESLWIEAARYRVDEEKKFLEVGDAEGKA